MAFRSCFIFLLAVQAARLHSAPLAHITLGHIAEWRRLGGRWAAGAISRMHMMFLCDARMYADGKHDGWRVI